MRSFPIAPLLLLAVAPIGVSLLQLALSRAREGEADLEAAELTGDPHGLASALVKMRRREQTLLRGRFPLSASLRVPSIFRDHPATEERIRQLSAMLQPRDTEAAEDDPLDLTGYSVSRPRLEQVDMRAERIPHAVQRLRELIWISARRRLQAPMGEVLEGVLHE